MLNRNMITSIRTLESDNVLYQSELNELKHSVFSDKKQADLKLLNTLSIIEKEVDSKKCEKLSRNKLMILSDQQGRNFNKIFQSVTNKFSVESFIKSGASFLCVIENIKELSSSYNQNDYVIVVAGLNDFRNGKVPPLKNIMAKLSNCVHTNIVVLSVPFGKFDEWTENQIYEFNGMLKNYLNQFRHIFFMDTNINNSLIGKNFLARNVVTKILENSSANISKKSEFEEDSSTPQITSSHTTKNTMSKDFLSQVHNRTSQT
ncbi:hypothetical protein JTB14_038467 [Gonioctena quinquepunctata]|nr:hypothetical protein JTB14_038467 [Gonioctena quinquepunctata]